MAQPPQRTVQPPQDPARAHQPHQALPRFERAAAGRVKGRPGQVGGSRWGQLRGRTNRCPPWSEVSPGRTAGRRRATGAPGQAARGPGHQAGPLGPPRQGPHGLQGPLAAPRRPLTGRKEGWGLWRPEGPQGAWQRARRRGPCLRRREQRGRESAHCRGRVSRPGTAGDSAPQRSGCTRRGSRLQLSDGRGPSSSLSSVRAAGLPSGRCAGGRRPAGVWVLPCAPLRPRAGPLPCLNAASSLRSPGRAHAPGTSWPPRNGSTRDHAWPRLRKSVPVCTSAGESGTLSFKARPAGTS